MCKMISTPMFNFAFIILGLIIVTLFAINSIPKPEKKSDSLVIAFGGDTMLGRMVNEHISNKQSESRYKYPWGNILDLLHSTDLNIINLETTLTNSEKIVPKVFNFKATPDKVKILQEGRIDLVNLANNHIRDFSDEGLFETIQVLDNAGIKHVGAGKNLEAAKEPIIINKKGIKIGIIGYTDNEPDWKAQEDKPGTNFINVPDLETVKKDIAHLREKVDIVIVTMHWGPNMRVHPPQEFINFAHALIDAGVDIFHGHSAHIFQGIEIYKNKLIMYDTGDFVDDYAIDPQLRNDQSLLFLVTLDKDGIKKVDLIPLLISSMQVNKATGKDEEEILERIKSLSAQFKTYITQNNQIIVNQK